MSESKIGRPSKRPRHWGAWPLGLVVAAAVVVVVGVPAAGFYTYQTYDYIQHDNDFCMSCHLMEGPFEAFNRSEHRGLGCKACHQPTLMGRSQMALTQVIQQPEEIEEHAHVPDELCTACHVDGDPDEWRLIQNSAGHRVHLESTDETLADVQCVSCHSTSIHEFSSKDESCATADCHTESEIHLGRMAEFEIGCGACHSFRAPVSDEADVIAAAEELHPTGDECLSCHVMRSMVDLPEDDPHEEICADCHNPHTQEVAEDASAGCSVGGCHDAAADESEFHVGLLPEALDDCSSCHVAHDFSADGSDCRACHGDMSDEGLGGAVAPGRDRIGVGAAHISGHGLGATPVPHLPLGDAQVVRPQEDPERPFLHSEHLQVDCLSCHASEGGHGAVTVSTATECQTCHHEAPRPPAMLQCETCHSTTQPAWSAEYPVVRPLDLSTGRVDAREIQFLHEDHADEACADCHVGEPLLSAEANDCNACHTEHHALETNCASCHVEAPAEEHPLLDVHQTCSGSGCHVDPPVEDVPQTRTACLVCHQDQTDHLPEQSCVSCHPISGSDA